MLANPKPGQKVQINYKDKTMPLQGKKGEVQIVGKGKPRNHGIKIDGTLYVIPCGNLIKQAEG